MEPDKSTLTLFCLSCNKSVTSPHDKVHDTLEIEEYKIKREQALRRRLEFLKSDRGAIEGIQQDLEELRPIIKKKKERLDATTKALNKLEEKMVGIEKDVKSYEDTLARCASLEKLKEEDLKMDPANCVLEILEVRNEMEVAAAGLNLYCIDESLVVDKFVQMIRIRLAIWEKLSAEAKMKMSVELSELEQKIAEKKTMLESLVDFLAKGDATKTASSKMQEALKTECANKVKAMDVDFKATVNKETASIMEELRRVEQTLLARKDNPAPIQPQPQPDDSKKTWKLEQEIERLESANKELAKKNEELARQNVTLKSEKASCDELRAENERLNKEVATQKQDLNRVISGRYRESEEQKATIKELQSEIANLKNNQHSPIAGLDAHAKELAEKNKVLLQDNTWLNSKIATLEGDIKSLKSRPQTANAGVRDDSKELRESLNKAEANLDALGMKLKAANGDYEALLREVVKYKKDREATKTDITTAFQKLDQQLKNVTKYTSGPMLSKDLATPIAALQKSVSVMTDAVLYVPGRKYVPDGLSPSAKGSNEETKHASPAQVAHNKIDAGHGGAQPKHTPKAHEEDADFGEESSEHHADSVPPVNNGTPVPNRQTGPKLAGKAESTLPPKANALPPSKTDMKKPYSPNKDNKKPVVPKLGSGASANLAQPGKKATIVTKLHGKQGYW